MLKRSLKLVVGFAVAFAALGAVFVVAMRKKYPPVQDAIRRMNREVTNPQQMATAGQPGAYASIIEHVGRTSGTTYRTPVQARPTEEGFVIPLPYGRSPDWLKNVLAAGSATLITEGSTYAVDQPGFIPTDAAEPYVADKDLRTQKLFGVDEYLELHRVEEVRPDDAAEGSAERIEETV